MAFLVKKFGGSSVATSEKIQAVAERIIRTKEEQDRVVVVVSAMGDTTDELISLAQKVCGAPYSHARELDQLLTTGEQVSIALLAMALRSKGCPAISLTGPQAGIATTAVSLKGKIRRIEPKRVLAELDKGKVVVVAGFQGLAETGDITTLGRGGSDTSAVALAGALQADVCEILTDVDGVYSADPRIVPSARKMKEITYNEMLEMARLGAVVMQPRAVEMGKNYGIPIHVRSTFTEITGTIIREAYTMEEKECAVRGVTHDTHVAKVAVLGVPDQPGIAHLIFSALAQANIDVDMIVQSIRTNEKGIIDMVFTIGQDDAAQTRILMEELALAQNFGGVEIDEAVAKVSIVGAGMYGSPGVAAKMFGALGSMGINLEVISTSEISVSCLIREERTKEAVNAVHALFFPDK